MAAPRTIDSWIATHAAHQPNRAALHFGGRSWTYRDLHDRIGRMASALVQALGLRRGDRIAFYGHNSAAQVALLFAAARVGLILVPLNWRLSPEELRYIVGNCGARCLFHGPEFADRAPEVVDGTGARAVPADAAWSAPAAETPVPAGDLRDPYLIVYTSGTTGRPKGAVLTQEAVLWNALSSLHAYDLTADDHILNILPLFHVGGINIQMMPTFFVGGTVTLHGTFDPAATRAALADDGITTAVCVPTILRALLRQGPCSAASFPRLRMLTIGSTDVPVDLLEAVNAGDIPLVQVYGATETGPVATYQRAVEARATIGSIGRPGAHVRIRIVRDDGGDCAVAEPGEIWVKGPNNFSHYWQDPAATEAALGDGWFRTGDVAYRDETGLLWFVGRLKHVIISGGENIYPAEVERILGNIEGVREVALVGRPDDRWGEVPIAVAAIEAGGPDRDALLGACAGRIARFKCPKDVVFVDALPKNALGKIIVADVRALVLERLRDDAGRAPPGDPTAVKELAGPDREGTG